VDSPLPKAFAGLDDVEVAKLVREKIETGVDAIVIVKELQEGMNIFSRNCQTGDYFISDLILAGDMFQQSMQLLRPLLKAVDNPDVMTKIVLGTVKGDIHNLGKDILGVLLSASGFEVIDLGINVAPAVFVEKIKETRAPILGLSGLITPSFEFMKATVQALESAGLRKEVKVIIGGGIVSEIVRNYAGADAFSTDAMEGVNLCKQLARGT
jgi:methanogenic corrinoid protein MtbC1